MKTSFQAVAASLVGLVTFATLLFLPAGTFNYWQAWVFIAVFSIATTAPSIYWAMRRPEVLQRRMTVGPTAETRPAQKAAVIGLLVSFAALLAVSAFDHRFSWSTVPAVASLLGDLLVAIGLGISMLVAEQNSFAASNITVEAEQKVVSAGLYGLVRHPMYLGALIMMVGVPLALGSYWGLVVLGPTLIVFAARIFDEEKMLNEQLGGYPEYSEKVRSRLVPYVW